MRDHIMILIIMKIGQAEEMILIEETQEEDLIQEVEEDSVQQIAVIVEVLAETDTIEVLIVKDGMKTEIQDQDQVPYSKTV